MRVKTCVHLESAKPNKEQGKYECAECVKTGDSWVHLRTCQTCGATHCCDYSPNKHASAHHAETGHPVVMSAEPKEDWLYCYNDKLFGK